MDENPYESPPTKQPARAGGITLLRIVTLLMLGVLVQSCIALAVIANFIARL
jgi:hypothetical protein